MPGLSEVKHPGSEAGRYILEGFDGGLHSENTVSRMNLLPTECSCATNVELWPVGTISKRYGMSYKNTSSQLSGAVLSIYEWWNSSGANFIVVFTAAATSGDPFPTTEGCSGEIYYFVPSANPTEGTFNSILSGGALAWNPTTEDSVLAETFGGSAFFSDGLSEILVWDGVSCCAVNTAPVGPKAMRGFKNYLFLANAEVVSGGSRHQSRIWWSDPGDGHTWPAQNYLDLDSDDGDFIVGMELLGNELIVFKERKIYSVSYVGGQYDFYAEARITGTGCGAAGSIVPIFSELCFYGIEAFYSFNGRDIEDLSAKIKDFVVSAIQPQYRAKIIGITYEEKDQLWWTAPIDATATTSGNTHVLACSFNMKDAIMIYDMALSCVTWYSQTSDLTFGGLVDTYNSYGISWGSRLFLSNSQTLIAGTYDGYLVDVGTHGINSDFDADFVGNYKTGWIDFNLPDSNKRITRITFFIDKEKDNIEEDYNLYVNLYTNWDDTTIVKTTNLSVVGSTPILERRVDVTLPCRSVKLEFGTLHKNEPFSVHRVVIEYYQKGRTLV